jgi:hypothetical protein
MNVEQLFPNGVPCPPDCSCHGPAPSVTPAQVLRRAARELVEKGWIQGRTVDLQTGALCAQGAIEVAAIRLTRQIAGREHAAALELVQDYLDSAIHVWNDQEARTAEQVIAVLNAVADQEDARAGVAQQPERRATSPEVAGSTPASRSTLDIDQLQSASNSESGWEAYEGLSPIEARYADGDR